MKNLFRFIKVYHFVLLFILLESFSLYLYISNHKFQKSRFLSFTQEYTGAIYSYYSEANQYISLKDENDYLKRENAKLYSLLSREEYNPNTELHSYIPSRVIKNSIFKSDNFIILNKGVKDGVKIGMGVTVQEGVIGRVHSTSENYSKIISILNQKSSVSISHVKSGQNGSLKWDGVNYMFAIIKDIPNHANVSIGDTICTNGFSSTYPKGINIGTIFSFRKGTENGLYNIKVKFLNNMNTVSNVYIIRSLYKQEIEAL